MFMEKAENIVLVQGVNWEDSWSAVDACIVAKTIY